MTPREIRPAPLSSPTTSPGGLWSSLPYAAAALGLLVPCVMLVVARVSGGPFAFPVDDAWIHLTYARNLARHGAFTYFPGDHTTTGSTAPLFTLLEATGFLVTRREFLIGLGLGLAAHALFLWALARWAVRRLGHPGWAALAVTLVALDGRFGMLAASGMETSLFLAGVALAFLAWSGDDALGAGIALGLAMWVRPETLILAAVFAVDAALDRRMPRRAVAGLGVLAALVAGYALFNQLTGGAAFPNTLAAKAAFYAGRSFTQFAREDLAATFAAAWLVMVPFAIVGAIVRLRPRRDDAAGGASAGTRSEFGWAIALPLAYALVLPYSHRFNRYLVPALPALAIAGVAGVRTALGFWTGAGRGAPGVRVGALVAASLLLAAQGLYFLPSFTEYGAIARYHAARHVRAGRWLAEHTPADAVVATHDVGAIAFYSGRRIVDMVGLVSPEVLPHLNRPDYLPYLARLFDERHVTHLAVLEEWQAVDNETPLFEADPEPERLHIYAWRPGVTHLLSAGTVARLAAARAELDVGRADAAEVEARHALALDPEAAAAWTALGAIELRRGHREVARAALLRALALYPESPEARLGLERATAAP